MVSGPFCEGLDDRLEEVIAHSAGSPVERMT
jgi:hypothetical protein